MQKKKQKTNYSLDSLLADLRSVFLEKVYIPLSKTALIARLKIPASQKDLFIEALSKMISEEEIVIEKSKIIFQKIVGLK